MAVKVFGNERLVSTDVNTYLANSGLVFVKQVTVGSAVATIDVTSCFSSTYDNYVISISGVTCSSSGSVTFALLSGTTPTSTGWYGTEFFCAIGGTAWSAQIASNNGGSTYCSAYTSAAGFNALINVQSPNVAQYARLQYSVIDQNYMRNGFAYQGSNTQYDGLRLTSTAGTWTGGRVAVYGYRLG